MADLTDNLDDGAALRTLMSRLYPLVVERAFGDASLAGVPVSFSIDNPFVQTVLDQLAKDVRRVAETTKDEIRVLIGRQAAEGWSIDRLAAELEQLAEIRSQTRAVTIARTETGRAYNLGAVAAYRTAGLTHVDVLDGDDDEPCASANGSRWTLDEAAANPLGHPNCVRAFTPILSE
jgi:hypothetical protein